MSKVVQIRDVPDDVHTALVQAAKAEGLSLTRYALRELERAARRPAVTRHNADVIDRVRREVDVQVPRIDIVDALQEGRDRIEA
ncbi:MAG: hypothetical protein CMH83_21440 [Nocardioides sp.]|nr:hypothetical protein [Nocardioides sp.]